MQPIYVSALSEAQCAELDVRYRKTQDPRLRTRAHMVLLSAEQELKGPQIAAIVRESEARVWRWLQRYLAEGIEGLMDAPRSGRPCELTPEYQAQVLAAVRRRPRCLGLPFSLWTLQRLVDYLAEKTGWGVSDETVRRSLRKAGLVLSRPQHTISSPDPEYQVKKRRLKRAVAS